MTILHIEHSITDFTQWTAAFMTFADRRRQAGVRAERICRPVDDPHYIVIDLEFDNADQASKFRDFLAAEVWSTPSNSPALTGRPVTRILQVESLLAPR